MKAVINYKKGDQVNKLALLKKLLDRLPEEEFEDLFEWKEIELPKTQQSIMYGRTATVKVATKNFRATLTINKK